MAQRLLLLVGWLLAAAVAASHLSAAGDRIDVVRHDDMRRVDVMIDGKPFTSYIYPTAHVTKPVLFPLRTARGTPVTRGFPLEPRPGERTDHPHQVGAWFTYGDVNGVDFWGYSDETPANEIAKKGRIRHRAITAAAGGPDRGELGVTADWVMPDGSTILDEETRFVFRGDSSSRTVDRFTRWTARGTRAVFKDTKEGAFGMRVARSLEHPTNDPGVFTDSSGHATTVPKLDNSGVTGQYRSSEGTTGEAVWGTRARWMMLTGIVEGESVTLAICDHPSNAGYPTYWHARGYGLFTANPFGKADFTNGKERMDFSLDPGRSVEFRYRILIVSGQPSSERVAASCGEFARVESTAR
jgi:hypothetical protein